MRSDLGPDSALVRESLLMLGMINAFQPLDLDALISGLANVMSRERFESALDQLEAAKLVRHLANGSIIATWKGVNTLRPLGLRRECDISRMQFLWERARMGEKGRPAG